MTVEKKYAEKVAKRISHIEKHLLLAFSGNDECVSNIQNSVGSPPNSARALSSHALASGMKSWFVDGDLIAMRQWLFVAAKLDKLVYSLITDTQGPGGRTLQLLKPLLSNNRRLIEWFSRYDGAYDFERINNTKTHDFWAYQAVVALRGEWDRLAERCERVLANPPKSSADQKYFGDHEFYLALARKEPAKMEAAIHALLSPKALSGRSNDESGYTEDLISTPAVIYSKIAWYHGFRLDIQSPYVPQEWLPTEPLAHYDDVYPFLKDEN